MLNESFLLDAITGADWMLLPSRIKRRRLPTPWATVIDVVHTRHCWTEVNGVIKCPSHFDAAPGESIPQDALFALLLPDRLRANMTSSTNRKYITYRNASGGGPISRLLPALSGRRDI